MATKKKTEEVVEEVKEVEAVETAEEAPKKTTRKSTKKKTEEVAEEQAPAVEEVKEEVKEEPQAEVEVVGKRVAEVVEVPEPVKVAEPAAEGEYQIQVVSPSGIFTFKNPGLDQPKGKVYAKGSKLTVTEVKGNWAKVGENKWIILSGAVVKI